MSLCPHWHANLIELDMNCGPNVERFSLVVLLLSIWIDESKPKYLSFQIVYAMTVDQLCPRPRSFIPFYSRLLINLANDVALYTDCVPYARSTMILLVAMQPTIYCRFLVTDNGLHICTLFILLCFTRINLGVNKLPLGLYVALI